MFFFLRCFRVGYFLAWRNIRRASFWTTALIIFVMTLTFLNLVVVSGILVGLIEGSSQAYKSQYSSDLIISSLPKRFYIEDTPRIIKILENFSEVEAISTRYLKGARLEANYQTKTNPKIIGDQVGTQVAGINPEKENKTTKLSNLIVFGEYLNNGDRNGILIGTGLLKKYSPSAPPGFELLEKVEIGDKVRLNINGLYYEFEVRGFVKSKIGEVGQRVYILDDYLRQILSRNDYSADEIVIKLKAGADPNKIKNDLLANGVDKTALVMTAEESQGQFFKDLKKTFEILGTAISAIGLIVASITIFIVIFINALSRRRYIGISKGIGICGLSIEISYILQSIFYSLVGVILGAFLTYAFLVPYFNNNPIDFPFSDGILVVPLYSTMVRMGLLFFTTVLAGYVPAKLIVRKNTLEAILGR